MTASIVAKRGTSKSSAARSISKLGTAAGTITGALTLGGLQTAAPPALTTALSYQWKRDGVAISGQTASTRTVVAADIAAAGATAHVITCDITVVTTTTPVTIPGTQPAVVTPPSAPLNLTLVAGDGKVTATWDAPASNGGAAIVGGTVTLSNGVVLAGVSPLVLTTPNGTAVTATATVFNGTYNSVVSAVSNSVTPVAPTVAAVPSGTVGSYDIGTYTY